MSVLVASRPSNGHVGLLEMLAVLREAAMAEITPVPGTDCLLHPTGRLHLLGGVFQIKKVLYQAHTGTLLKPGQILTRTCPTPHCAEPTHHLAESRQEFGFRLGTGATWRASRSA